MNETGFQPLAIARFPRLRIVEQGGETFLEIYVGNHRQLYDVQADEMPFNRPGDVECSLQPRLLAVVVMN